MAFCHLLDAPHTAHPSPGDKDPQNSSLVPSRRLSSSPYGSLLLLREHLHSDSSLTHCPQHRGHISTLAQPTEITQKTQKESEVMTG